ncbi:TPM domain-containing protein, partial [Myxococcus vastator]|uniref:TPM domain-containing protein n=1 Tax=Myxococcus vastator TaxID=2709664 RepID=UPI001F074032
MTGTLTPRMLAEVDQLGEALVRDGQGQLAVVVVDTTGSRPPRAFALELFNRWGLGTARRNDGALLFVALKDRAAEIILGDGVDGPGEQARSDAIMANDVVPAFKRGSPDDAVLEGARGLHQLIVTSELNQPRNAQEAAPAWDPRLAESAWSEDSTVTIVSEESREQEGSMNVPALAGGVGLV